MSTSNSLCRAPEVWHSITVKGEVRPCTAFRGTVGRVDSDNFDQLKDLVSSLDRGIKHPGCAECWHREALGLSSQRLDGSDWREAKGIHILEFNLSNLCHLKCRMCLSDSSSAWIDEELLLQQDAKVGLFRPDYTDRLQTAFKDDTKLIEYLIRLDLKNLKKVSFKGGEPLLHKQMYIILDYLIGIQKTNVTISITTSGLIYSAKLKILKNFSAVDFTVSVEAIGLAYQYIRGGKKHKLRDVEKNILLLQNDLNIRPTITSCVGALNIFSLGDLYNWVSEKTPWAIADGYIQRFWPSIYQPEYLTVLALSTALRRQAKEYNESVLRKHGLFTDQVAQDFNRFYQLEKGARPMIVKQFIAYTQKLDDIRGETLSTAIPQLRSLQG